MRFNRPVLLFIGIFPIRIMCHADCAQIQDFNLDVDDVGQKLIGHVIQTREQTSLARCARECGRLSSCLSFNYEKVTRSCQMNSANRATTGVADFMQEPAFIYSDITRWPQQMVRHCSTKPCGPRSTCIPYENSHICHALGPASCSMLKQCSPDSGDGEYWIYPALLSDKIRVYCHNMTSDSPKEYLTLRSGTTNSWNLGGGVGKNSAKRIDFDKVAVNLTTMSIIGNDFTFSDDDGTVNTIQFGVAAGCRKGSTGSMDIDTTETGLILDPTITWVAIGYKSFISHFSRSDNGTTINARCGGRCGRCEPNGPLKLQLNTNEDVSLSSATEVICG